MKGSVAGTCREGSGVLYGALPGPLWGEGLVAPAGPVGWRSGCTTTRQVSAYSFPWDISPELMSKSVLPRVVLAAQISSISSPPAGILNFTGVQKFVSQHHQGATNKPNDDFCNSFPYTSGCIIHRDSTLVSKGPGTIAWAR